MIRFVRRFCHWRCASGNTRQLFLSSLFSCRVASALASSRALLGLFYGLPRSCALRASKSPSERLEPRVVRSSSLALALRSYLLLRSRLRPFFNIRGFNSEHARPIVAFFVHPVRPVNTLPSSSFSTSCLSRAPVSFSFSQCFLKAGSIVLLCFKLNFVIFDVDLHGHITCLHVPCWTRLCGELLV